MPILKLTNIVACALVGMPGMCTWYVVHDMRYEVRGYEVRGAKYGICGTWHGVHCAKRLVWYLR